MAEYQIEITEEANEDLRYYAAYERKIIVSEIRAQLVHQPSVETKNRKRLRENPIATWEPRSGKYRVFYQVDENRVTVSVVAAGHKEHNVLFIKGEEVSI